MSKPLSFFVALVALALFAACSTPTPVTTNRPEYAIPIGPERAPTQAAQNQAATTADQNPTPEPTPEDPTPTPGPLFQDYKVRPGDTLGAIATQFECSPDDIVKLNGLKDPKRLQVGQVLRIPVQSPLVGPAAKLVPDSEAVYGPGYAHFDVNAVAQQYGGYLASYQERVEGQVLTGPQIIQLVAERFSVGPRVLLTILEMQGHWVTSSAIGQAQMDYPFGDINPAHARLYRQAFWAASSLNEGYYGRLLGTLNTLEFKDKRRARLAPGLNPGSAAIQNMLAHQTTWDNWQSLVGPDGFRATYLKLFGDPLSHEVQPLVPRDLKQPTLRLPFPDGHLWYFTGGPHAGWADGSAWAAVDFTPKDQAGSCWTSSDWAIAAAPGLIVQAERGRVIEDLDGDGFQGTGWALLYMHMAAQDRVPINTHVNTGDHIGHPSCEGGAAETSHLHFARLYNGQWIPAGDAQVPLVMSGWVVQSAAEEYDGTMVRGTQTYEAVNGQLPQKNGVVADGGPKVDRAGQ